MSARIEAPQIRRGLPGASTLVAVVVAAVVGGLVGSAITQVVADRTTPAPITAGASSAEDAGRLEASAGRQLAAAASVEHQASVTRWNDAKLDAMQGRQLAAAASVERDASVTRWSDAKLDAMQGSTPR